jgi:hypothetical protein
MNLNTTLTPTATVSPTNTMSTTAIEFPTAALRLITKTSPIASVSLTISGSPVFHHTPIKAHTKHLYCSDERLWSPNKHLHPFQPHLP